MWIRLGERGSLLSSASAGTSLIPAPPTTVADVTGAGDAMLAAFCHALLGGSDLLDAARYGMRRLRSPSRARTPCALT